MTPSLSLRLRQVGIVCRMLVWCAVNFCIHWPLDQAPAEFQTWLKRVRTVMIVGPSCATITIYGGNVGSV